MGREQTARGSVLKTEASADQFIPYTCHIDERTIKTRDGDLIQVIKVAGVSHETSDISDINTWYEGRNNLYKNIADHKLAIWTTIIRHEQNIFPEGDFPPGFAETVNTKYRKKIGQEKAYVNDMYIAIVQRNISDVPFFGQLAKKLKSKSHASRSEDEREAIRKLTDTTNTVVKMMDRYGAKTLGTYEHNNHMFSEVLEYLGYLVNGFHQRIPLPRKDIANVLCNTRIFFGNESFEIRGIREAVVGATLGIKEYCPETGPGMLDGLLSLPFSFVLSQSFSFLTKASAVGMMRTQRNRMEQAGDLAESQIEEIRDALDDLTSSRFVMGDHHLTFTVMGENGRVVQDRIAAASTEFGDMEFVTAREDLALESAYWSQLPGNHSYRPRKAPITSKNFSGLMSFHNFPTGEIDGNHWGPAMTVVKTTSGTLYYFSMHLDDLGNGTVIGPSGTGKTVFMGFMMAQSEKFLPKVVFFDKDRGAEIFIRAQRGRYTPIKVGEKTGFNPFQLENTKRNRAFISKWIKILVTSHNEPFGVTEQTEIATAIKGLMAMPANQRCLSSFLPFLDGTKAEGVAKRIKPWTGDGENAWAFDNETDSLNLDARLLGFDITELLDSPIIRTPILFYLFHRIEELINGDRIMIYIDEGWKAVEDPVFAPRIIDWEKTIRKRNGLLIFGTQGAKDAAADSKIGNTIIEQSPTNIFMPNPKASRVDYVDGFHLSETEYQIIKTLPEKSHQFLIRKGQNSVVAELDLGGMPEEIAILSGTEANVNLLDQIREEVGDNPDDWLPVFLERRKEA